MGQLFLIRVLFLFLSSGGLKKDHTIFTMAKCRTKRTFISQVLLGVTWCNFIKINF